LPVELVVTGDIFFYSKEKIRVKWWVSRNWHCGKMLFVCKKKGIFLESVRIQRTSFITDKKTPLSELTRGLGAG
jgi:hypothetical protein